MQNNLTVVMTVVIVIAIGISFVAERRWSGPWWLSVIGAVVGYPFTHVLLDQVEGAPDGWLRTTFSVACGVLVGTLSSPLYFRLRKPGAKDGLQEGAAKREPGTSEAPSPRS
ncbi:hypothetical protein ACFVOK_27005 [Streptomyces sp. NPDC057798]|uniref:hypothetical protein n=1 Tax=Streptomyces sp. NPDC057798 TaxID=3346252 RepID=UPI00368B939C